MRLLDAQLFPLLEALELSKVWNVLADDIRFLKLKLINIFLNLSFTTYFPKKIELRIRAVLGVGTSS